MFTFERLRASLSSQRGKKFFATALVALFAIFMVMGSTEYVFAQGVDSVTPATTPAPAVTPTEATNQAADAVANDRTGAACTGDIKGFICDGISTILGLIANLIGNMILLVVSVLIAFAQYNGFSDAMPVVQGWIVVRDTTNMFFIIVLLLTAFATVIGRDEFHYEKVLPKLLLQAVLINFSKTLIQLLIDFSQVVMLTFVNAFAQSAAGNFVYALGLDKMMSLNADRANVVGMANIILAYGLAIFFMSIALGVVIILTCYLVYRIVALWITLILAPLAFFASALPEKLQRGMGAITGEYWKRLSGLLTGGPVIAFFLWLTLAITQQSSQTANEAGGLSYALNLTRPPAGGDGGTIAGAADSAVGATFGFINEIGDSNHVISFVVGIALMLAALDTAVASAAAMGGLAGLIASKTKSLAKGVVKAPYTLAKGAAKGAARGARAAGKLGYNIADQQFAKRTGNSLSRRIGVAGVKAMGYASSVPLVGGAIRRTDKYQKAESGLTQFAGRVESRTKELTDADKKRAANLAGLARSGTEEQELLEIARAGTLTRGSIGMAYSEQVGQAEFAGKMADTALNERLYKERKHEYKDMLVAQYLKEGMDPSTAETTAKAASEQLVRKELFDARAAQVKTQRQNAIDRGDKTKIEEYEKLVRSNPLLATDIRDKEGEPSDREKALKDLVTSPDAYKDVDEFTSNNGEVVAAFMLANGWTQDANGVISLTDEADWKKKKLEVARVNKNLHQAMEAQELFLNNSPGTKVSQLNQMQFKKNKSDGSMHSFALNNDTTSSPNMVRGQRVRSVNQETALKAIKTEAGMNAANVMGAVSYGAPLSEVLNNSYVDSSGRGASDVVAESVAANMAAASNVLSEVTNATENYNAARKEIEDQYNFDLQTVGNDKQQIEELKKERLAELAEAKAKYEDIKANTSRYVTEASRAMAPAVRAMQQIGADGVKPEARAKMLQELTKTDANGNALVDLRSIYQQYGSMSGPHQDALNKTLAAVLDESDRLRKIENSGKTLLKEEQDILKAGDQLRVDMVRKGQRLPRTLRETLERSDNPSDQYPAA